MSLYIHPRLLIQELYANAQFMRHFCDLDQFIRDNEEVSTMRLVMRRTFSDSNFVIGGQSVQILDFYGNICLHLYLFIFQFKLQ